MGLKLSLAAGANDEFVAGGEGYVRRSVLPGGVRLLTEFVPQVRSVALGAWLPVGSRDERDGHFGSTHFLEHLLFKGTTTRSAMDIATAFDEIGGEANAATGKEHTCYYARVLDSDAPMALAILLDMVTSALLDEAEFETERGVILEELAMNEDDPTDVAHEAFAAAVFGAHPLARPIGGTPETIRAVPRAAVWEHYRQHYRPENLVLTAAGNLDHDALATLALDALASGGWDLAPDAVPLPRRDGSPADPALFPAAPTRLRQVRPVEQANVITGTLAPSSRDDRRFALNVLTTLLGGGMSSRLFQEVRERRGLAYAVYAFASGHAETGSFGMYAGCTPANAEKVVALCGEEFERLAADGAGEVEVRRAIGQICGSLVLGLEDTSSRMFRLGRAEIVMGELLDIDETLARLRAVTPDDVRDLAAELAAHPRTTIEITHA